MWISHGSSCMFNVWYASKVGLYPPLGPGTPFTSPKLRNDCIWFLIVPEFLPINFAIFSHLTEVHLDFLYRFINVCNISFCTDVNIE